MSYAKDATNNNADYVITWLTYLEVRMTIFMDISFVVFETPKDLIIFLLTIYLNLFTCNFSLI